MLVKFNKLKIFLILTSLAVCLLLSGPSYAGEKISLCEEIQRAESLLKHPFLDRKTRGSLERYLEVLRRVQNGIPNTGLQKHPEKLSKGKIQRIKTVITSISKWAGEEISGEAIYHFLNCIEDYKARLKATPLDYSTEMQYPLMLSGGIKNITIFPSVDISSNKRTLFLDFGNEFRQHGTSKRLKTVLHYCKTCSEVATLVSFQNERSLATVQREIDILWELQQLPATQRAGLADILGSLPNQFFQTLFDLDLFEFSARSMGTLAQKIEIISQLAHGLNSLQKLGIAHNDIKLENILIKDMKKDQPLAPDRYLAVYNDFGLSRRPLTELNEGRKRIVRGTVYTLPPEIQMGWIGPDEEKVQNWLKGDVFSQALVALLVLKKNDALSIYECDEFETDISTILSCRSQVLLKLREKYLQRGFHSSLEHLLLRGLELHPKKRITAEQFARGMTYISKNLNRRKVFVERSLEDLNSHLRNFPRYRPDQPPSMEPEIPKKGSFILSRPGDYFLKPVYFRDSFLLELNYFDQNSFYRRQKLSIDPLDQEALTEEIRFLQELGTLKNFSRLAPDSSKLEVESSSWCCWNCG